MGRKITVNKSINVKLFEQANTLPSIDMQIEFLRTIRKFNFKHYYDKGELSMIYAIEQSLLAAKLSLC